MIEYVLKFIPSIKSFKGDLYLMSSVCVWPKQYILIHKKENNNNNPTS